MVRFVCCTVLRHDMKLKNHLMQTYKPKFWFIIVVAVAYLHNPQYESFCCQISAAKCFTISCLLFVTSPVCKGLQTDGTSRARAFETPEVNTYNLNISPVISQRQQLLKWSRLQRSISMVALFPHESQIHIERIIPLKLHFAKKYLQNFH